MNALKLSWKILLKRKNPFLSSILLFAFSLALMAILIQLKKESEHYFKRNLKGTDLVVGAEGSPLQLVLSSVLHIDYPTGNVKIEELEFLDHNSLVKNSIPISMGDNLKGFRIIGTTKSYLEHFNLELTSGSEWNASMQVYLGNDVARKLGLKVGDTFFSAHGMNDDDMHIHDDEAFTVVAILKKSGTVNDNLILTHFTSIWQVHDGHAHEKEAENEHEEHHHSDESTHEHHEAEEEHMHHEESEEAHHHHHHGSYHFDDNWAHYREKEITALLIKFKNPIAAIQLPRLINEKNNLQAASPSFEISRLLELLGFGVKLFYVLAWVILAISAVNIFLALSQLIRDKTYEFTMLRVMGGSKILLFSIPIIQSIITSIFGGILGFSLKIIVFFGIQNSLENQFYFQIEKQILSLDEIWLFLALVLLSILSASIPAFRLYQQKIHQVLASK